MTQRTTSIFIDEIYSRPPQKSYITNQTDVHHTDDIWSLDTLDLKDCGHENMRGYRQILVVIDNLSIIGFVVALIKAQTPMKLFENILLISERKPNLIEKELVKEF